MKPEELSSMAVELTIDYYRMLPRVYHKVKRDDTRESVYENNLKHQRMKYLETFEKLPKGKEYEEVLEQILEEYHHGI